MLPKGNAVSLKAVERGGYKGTGRGGVSVGATSSHFQLPYACQEWIERRLMGELEIVRGDNGSLVISSGHPELTSRLLTSRRAFSLLNSMVHPHELKRNVGE